ncbi:MAG: hypothetical protein IPK73_14570 [Candidatus Obscuribacter sp.]|nr:hypothetical protein [Candidatus Obscuribacter sp.]MBL8081622.1 hypothetical protein [Candidatus Obscuribacter sp.]
MFKSLSQKIDIYDSSRVGKAASTLPRLPVRQALLGSVFLTALADWLFILSLGSTIVFTGPGGDASGCLLLLVPLYIFSILMVITQMLKERLNEIKGKAVLQENADTQRRLDKAKLLRLVFALAMTQPQMRQFFLSSPQNTICVLCLYMLSAQWSLLFVLHHVRPWQGLSTGALSYLIAAWGAGQALAFKLAPAMVNSYPGLWPSQAAALLYSLGICLVYFADRGNQFAEATEGSITAQGAENKPDFYPHGLMVGLMSMPTLCLLIITAFLSVQNLSMQLSGQQCQPLTELAAKLITAFSLGALIAPIIENRVEQKKLWLFSALLTLSLYLAGALARESALSSFSLVTAAALTGSLATIEEARFLRNLPRRRQASVLCLRNAHVLLFAALPAVFLERSLPLVSHLYFLKELNVVSAVIATMALAGTPMAIVLCMHIKKRLARFEALKDKPLHSDGSGNSDICVALPGGAVTAWQHKRAAGTENQ